MYGQGHGYPLRTAIHEKLNTDRLRTLIDVGGFIVSELDLDVLLRRVLDAACELTGARYAALGVLNADRSELERFLTVGIDEDAQRRIGDLPRGRGVLGVLIEDPKPLRLAHVGEHPASYGFPMGHPPMETFLGVPVFIAGEAWGNLYLTEKEDGEFDEADEEAIVVLARWAGIAVENARLYHEVEAQRIELERAVAGLRATQAVALAVGAEVDLQRSLEMIVKRGRALVEARSVVILLRQGTDLAVAALAGHGERSNHRLPVEGSTSGQVMMRGRSERIDDVSARLLISADRIGVPDAHTALIVPLTYREEPLGVLMAFDRNPGAQPFTDEDERAMKAFAASAATAVVMAQSVEKQRLRDTLSASEQERRRWARELHDETLQALGGLRVLLSSARRVGSLEALTHATSQAVEQIEQEITNLRAIITELRPAALDELGLAAAVEALLERHRAVNGLEIASEIDLDSEAQLDDDLQATVYRVIQEALTNIAKHAHAKNVSIAVRIEDGRLALAISDDGRGFDIAERTAGFGVTGMHERVAVSGGELAIDSSDGGTAVTAWLPLDQRAALSVASSGASSPRRSA
ncbi:MAG: GAF domain-containing protein [Solirubrobacteraceae bacterium]